MRTFQDLALQTQDVFDVPGGITGGATPVPIPNTEVKPSKADDTAAARQWDSRTLPGYKKSLLENSGRLFYFDLRSTCDFHDKIRRVLFPDINHDRVIKNCRDQQLVWTFAAEM